MSLCNAFDGAGYSIWTNSSFKSPLICSAIACILGNFLYCLGYDTKWLTLLMAARLVTGLGELSLRDCVFVVLAAAHYSAAAGLLASYSDNHMPLPE